MLEYSADRAINRGVLGPDWGTVIDKYAPKPDTQPLPSSLAIGFMPTGRKTVGADWGKIEDLYSAKALPTNTRPELPPINWDALTPKPETLDLIKNGRLQAINKKLAAGMELNLPEKPTATINGRLFLDPKIAVDNPTTQGKIESDLTIKMGDIAPGLNGQEEQRLLFEGDPLAVLNLETQFNIPGKTVTLRVGNEVTIVTQKEATERLKALQAA